MPNTTHHATDSAGVHIQNIEYSDLQLEDDCRGGRIDATIKLSDGRVIEKSCVAGGNMMRSRTRDEVVQYMKHELRDFALRAANTPVPSYLP